MSKKTPLVELPPNQPLQFLTIGVKKVKSWHPSTATDRNRDAPLLEDRIFNRLDIVRKAPQIKNLGDALVFMIDIEMDVVDYFENVRKLVNLHGQALMKKIINEEKAHAKQLVDLRQQYKSVSLR